MVGFGEEGVGRVHLVEKLRHDAPDLSLTATFKSCVWFAVMIIFDKFRALDSLRHGRGDKLHGIGLVVSLGGEDQSLAPQVFVAAGGDVGLDGLAPFRRVDAKGGVLLGGFV